MNIDFHAFSPFKEQITNNFFLVSIQKLVFCDIVIDYFDLMLFKLKYDNYFAEQYILKCNHLFRTYFKVLNI